jgi:hypothetical protein
MKNPKTKKINNRNKNLSGVEFDDTLRVEEYNTYYELKPNDEVVIEEEEVQLPDFLGRMSTAM